MPKPDEFIASGYHLAVLLVMSAARNTKSTMKTGILDEFCGRMASFKLKSVSPLDPVTSSPLPLATLNSGSVGTPVPVLPLM